eukprot:2909319-Amphidinium_carterae.1
MGPRSFRLQPSEARLQHLRAKLWRLDLSFCQASPHPLNSDAPNNNMHTSYARCWHALLKASGRHHLSATSAQLVLGGPLLGSSWGAASVL